MSLTDGSIQYPDHDTSNVGFYERCIACHRANIEKAVERWRQNQEADLVVPYSRQWLEARAYAAAFARE